MIFARIWIAWLGEHENELYFVEGSTRPVKSPRYVSSWWVPPHFSAGSGKCRARTVCRFQNFCDGWIQSHVVYEAQLTIRLHSAAYLTYELDFLGYSNIAGKCANSSALKRR